MERVLIVDDEPSYRNHMANILSRRGFDVHASGTANEAIALGARFRPTVLVADWMLHDDSQGLGVAGALRLVAEQMRVVVVTGFDSHDLREQVAQVPRCAYLTKPIRLTELVQAVTEVVESEPVPVSRYPVAVMEIDSSGQILYANAEARALFETTTAGADAGVLTEALRLRSATMLDSAVAQWYKVTPRLREPSGDMWWLRLRRDPGQRTHILVMVPDEVAEISMYNPDLTLLLNLRSSEVEAHWPWPGPALMIEADAIWRDIARKQIERIGGGCYSTDELNEGVRLLESDRAISVVIIAAHPHDDLEKRVELLQAALASRGPAVFLVGTGREADRGVFADLGVSYFLRKPWNVRNLLTLLAEDPEDWEPVGSRFEE